MRSPSLYFSVLWPQMLISFYRVIPPLLSPGLGLKPMKQSGLSGLLWHGSTCASRHIPLHHWDLLSLQPSCTETLPYLWVQVSETSCSSQTLTWAVISFITNRSLCADPCLSGIWIQDCSLCIILYIEHDILLLQINRKEIKHYIPVVELTVS